MSSQDFDFKFKQFGINHNQCAMKVNTDGILLGAWANVNNAKRILDIGTGSGLIALMLAQRTQQIKAEITAIDIDIPAAQQARQNFAASVWSTRLKVETTDLLKWPTIEALTKQKFDLIVSNPPYFSNSLKNKDRQKTQARHNDSLSFDDLLEASSHITHAQSKLAIILPIEEAAKIQSLAPNYDWHLSRQLLVTSVEGKVTSRSLMEFIKHPIKKVQSGQLQIRHKKGNYSDAFTQLCQDFYLKM